MIKKTNMQNVRHLDFFQIMSLIRDYLKNEDLKTLKLTQAAAAFEEKLQQMDDSLKQSNSIAATRELLAADEARDKTLKAIGNALKNFANSPDEEEAREGEILRQELLKYGKNLMKLPLREESAAIINILQDFEKPAHAERVASLHLEKWVQKLKVQNDAFDALYKDRSGEQAEVVVGAVRTARAELQDAFDHLAKTINANAFLNGEEAYKNLAEKINVEISRALAEAKARSTKGINKEEPKPKG